MCCLGLELARPAPIARWKLEPSGLHRACRDKTCSGPGSAKADTAATSLALLPFLAAGDMHKTKGKYQKSVADGLAWLVRQQKPDGDLRGGATMYAHGLAAITLSEAYGMTGDRSIGYAASGRSISFKPLRIGEPAAGATNRARKATSPLPAGRSWRSRVPRWLA